MKKRVGLAMTAMCIALTAAPMTAQAAESTRKQIVTIPVLNGSGILIGNANLDCLTSLQEKLEAAGIDWEKLFGNCGLPEKPETPAPDVDGTVKPEEKPENNKPPVQEDTEDEETEENRSYAEQIVALVNAEREKAGLAPVTMSQELGKAAMIRAQEIEVSFSHTRPNGSYFTSVLKENGITYRLAGENIAWGQKSPEEVMRAWMNSAGHRANILNPNFKELGVAHYQNARGVNYFVQLFKQ